MTLNAMPIVGLIVLAIGWDWYRRFSNRRRRGEQLDTFADVMQARGEKWPYDLPGLEHEKESWRQNWKDNPPDLKDPIDSRD